MVATVVIAVPVAASEDVAVADICAAAVDQLEALHFSIIFKSVNVSTLL